MIIIGKIIKYIQKDVEKIYKSYNLELKELYKNARTKMLCIDNEGYYIDISLTNLMSGKNGRRFSSNNRKVIENIKHFIDINTNNEYEYVSGKYENAHSLLKIKHKKCGRIFEAKWCNINRKPSKNDKNRNGTRCKYCNANQIESTHAQVLKQIWLNEIDGTVVEDRSCINPNTNHSLPTDIVNHNLKIAIEIQSSFHDFNEQKEKDKIKKEYWINNNYEFVELDIRDYTLIESIQIFFPYLTEIPKYIDFEYSNKINDIKVQELLYEGYNVHEIANILNYNPHTIYDAIRYGRISYPNEYINASYSPVVQLSTDFEFIKEYKSINEAKRNTGIKSIASALYNDTNFSGGFIWVYKKDYYENKKVI